MTLSRVGGGVRALARVAVWSSVFCAMACTGQIEAGEGTVQVAALEGELSVYVVDFPDGASETRYALTTDSGEHVQVLFEREPETLLATGDRLRVLGRTLDAEYFDATGYELLEEARGEVAVSSHALTGNSVRTRSKLAVLLVHWGTPDSMTTTEIKNRLFTNANSTATYYRENSYGLVELTGDAFGWFQVPAMTSCNYTALATAARDAARAAGVALDSYQQVLYYFPRTSQCEWSGLAYIGRPTAPQRDSFYNGASGCTVLAHELLHNFGARHSRSYDCGSKALGGPSTCSYSEYGDPYDVMGGGCYHTNAYQKATQGWLGGCNVPTGAASNAVQLVRVPVSSTLCPSGLSPCYYYLEYRQPVGLFDGAAPTSPVHSGVLLHIGGNTSFGVTGTIAAPYMLDMTPASASSDFRDGVLALGRTFDDGAGVRITVDALSSSSATVSVRFANGGSGAPICADGTTFGAPPPPPPPPPGTCPSGTSAFGGHCYALSASAASYSSGSTACRNRGTTWRLATIESAEENTFVAGLTGSVEAYLGGTDATTEGAWTWQGSGIRFWNGGATGAPVAGVYQRFMSGEPNGGSTHDCMRIVSGGSWRDNSCSSSYRAVCESTP
jgi:hypothetical protein